MLGIFPLKKVLFYLKNCFAGGGIAGIAIVTIEVIKKNRFL